MDVYMFVRFSVFSSKESYRLCKKKKKISKLKYEARAQERAVEPLEKKKTTPRVKVRSKQF
jgi:hypothetical protein